MKYRDWLQEWLGYYVKPSVKAKTYEKYARQVRRYLAPRLGGYALEELTPLRLQKFAVSLTDGGLSANTANGIITVLQSSLLAAVNAGKAEREHGKSVVRPKIREKQVECFSKAEQKKLEGHILHGKNTKLFGIVVALYTGLRTGELLALRWEDVDLGKGLLTVRKTCYDGWRGGKYVKITDMPKTENSVRAIPLPRQLLPYIKEMKRRSGGLYMVPGNTEYGAEIRCYQRTFGALLKKLGIPHKGFHALRHTFATRAIEVGMDVKTLSEILGHKNPSVTLQRYAHSLLEHKAEMMNKLGKLLI